MRVGIATGAMLCSSQGALTAPLQETQWLLFKQGELLPKRQNLVGPISLFAKPGEGYRKRRVLPATRQPGAVIHHPCCSCSASIHLISRGSKSLNSS